MGCWGCKYLRVIVVVPGTRAKEAGVSQHLSAAAGGVSVMLSRPACERVCSAWGAFMSRGMGPRLSDLQSTLGRKARLDRTALDLYPLGALRSPAPSLT